jgi:hypothetical protein
MDRDIVVCRQELVAAPEPSDWRSWPVVPDLGGHVIAGNLGDCVGHGLLCGKVSAELRSPELCPRAGVSLDGWFTGSIYQHDYDVSVRESNGTFVVTGNCEKGMGPACAGAGFEHGKEIFLAAFRRHGGVARPVFVHTWVERIVLLFAPTLSVLLVAAVRARRAIRRAAEYRDTSRYRSGTRDATGTVTFHDETPPLVAPGAAGPVLVRVAAVSTGGYRLAPQTIADVVVDGDRDSVCGDLIARATATLRRATLGGSAFVVIVFVAFFFWYLQTLMHGWAETM